MNKLLTEIKKVIRHGNFKLKGGDTADYYLDLRSLYGDPKILKMIGNEFSKKIPKNTTCIAASGYGGIPIGTIVSRVTGLPLVLVRNEKKGHGLKDTVIGYQPTNKDSVIIVDDICTSGTSILETKKLLNVHNPKTIAALVMVKRGIPKEKIALKYLFSIKDILK